MHYVINIYVIRPSVVVSTIVFPLILLVFLQLNLLLGVWAFYVGRHSCSKKFQSRRQADILWVGLFFSSRKINSWGTTQFESILWHSQFIQINTKIERCKEIIFSLSIYDVTKKALFGRNMLNCTKTSKKKRRVV